MAVIAVFGLPGTGKSYLAKRIAGFIDATYLSSDQIRLLMFPNKRTYSEKEKDRVYKQMKKDMKQSILEGKDVVLDATFSSKKRRKKFIALAEKKNQSILWIETTADEKVIKERLSAIREFSEADFNVYKKLAKRFDTMKKEHMYYDSGKNNIDEFLEILQKKLHSS